MGVTVIGNPRAGRGKTGWDDVLAAMRAHGLDPSLQLTDEPGHATGLAADARASGADLVVAAGGDGTVHEVLNGLLSAGTGPGVPTLGVLPLGSGCDYAKTFDIADDLDAAVSLIASERPPCSVDVGEIVYREGRRFFANIAEVGIGAETVARAARLPRALGGAVYGIAFCMTLPVFRRARAEIRMDEKSYEGPLVDLVVAIGQVFGGGMRVAPEAEPDDGLFDVQVHHGTKIDYVRGLPKVYKGTHLPHPRIREERAASVEIECSPDSLVEADGELLGSTPASFHILPRALKLKA